MSVDKLVDSTQLDSDLTSVANAIRTKGGTSSQMSFPSGFVSAIENIHTGSTPTGTKEISITENGTTTEDVTDYAYAEIEVAVPASAVDSGTKNITANGTGQDVVGYAAVDVAVPNTYAAGDEGKVVSSGALVSQTSGSTSANGTVDTTLINSLSVSVPASAVVSGTLTVDSSGTKDVTNYQYASVPAGTGGGGLDSVLDGSAIAGNIVSTLSGPMNASPFKKSSITLSFVGDSITSFGQGAKEEAFRESTSLTSISLARMRSINGNTAMFYGCTGLTSVYLPNVDTVYANQLFRGCTNLEKIAFPSLGGSSVDYFYSQTFYGCSKLKVVDVNILGNIGSSTFQGCTLFDTLILRKTNGVVTVSHVNIFNSTPFANGGTGGTVYIPKAMYDHLGDNSSLDYQHASNWATLYGYGTITFAKIEGSYYETHYGDDTLIPTT